MKNAFLSTLFATIVLLLNSCTHKELCLHESHKAKVWIEFDWINAPNADPEGMCVYFYPVNGGSPYRVDFNNMHGGLLTIEAGHYHILAYNNDCEATQFDNHEHFDRHRAFTRLGSLLEPVVGATARTADALAPLHAAGAEEEAVAISPDELWGCSSMDIEILAHVDHDQLITLYPHDMLCTYTLEVRNVAGLERLQQVGGSLSGMSPALELYSEQLHTTLATIPFAADFSVDNKNITARFLTFGHHPDNPDPHKIMLYLWLKSGKKVYVGKNLDNYDVTEQVHSAPDRRRVHLIIDGLEIPEDDTPPAGGDIFDPSVDDWGEVNITIKM